MSAATLIREMRTSAHLTQAELARRSRIPRTVINAYEAGSRNPGSDALARLADACGARLAVVPRPRLDLARNADALADALDLAEQLPRRRRPDRLDFPPLVHR